MPFKKTGYEKLKLHFGNDWTDISFTKFGKGWADNLEIKLCQWMKTKNDEGEDQKQI